MANEIDHDKLIIANSMMNLILNSEDILFSIMLG